MGKVLNGSDRGAYIPLGTMAGCTHCRCAHGPSDLTNQVNLEVAMPSGIDVVAITLDGPDNFSETRFPRIEVLAPSFGIPFPKV